MMIFFEGVRAHALAVVAQDQLGAGEDPLHGAGGGLHGQRNFPSECGGGVLQALALACTAISTTVRVASSLSGGEASACRSR